MGRSFGEVSDKNVICLRDIHETAAGIRGDRQGRISDRMRDRPEAVIGDGTVIDFLMLSLKEGYILATTARYQRVVL